MTNKPAILCLLLALVITVVSCTSRDPSPGPTDATTVSEFGDMSNCKAEANPEREGDYIAPTTKELHRMKEFLDLNVPKEGTVKILETPWGETIDCVEIRKQPALLKRGMEGHELRLEPRGLADLGSLKELQNEKDTKPAEQEYARLPEICPEESIPIRRLTIDELARFRTLEEFLAKHPNRSNEGTKISGPEDLLEAGPTDKHQYAVGRRFVDNWGAESVLNVWKPYTEASKEFTLSQIWVARGSGSNLETVEVGWQKYKQKYAVATYLTCLLLEKDKGRIEYLAQRFRHRIGRNIIKPRPGRYYPRRSFKPQSKWTPTGKKKSMC